MSTRTRLAVALVALAAAPLVAEGVYRGWLHLRGTPYDSQRGARRAHAILTATEGGTPQASAQRARAAMVDAGMGDAVLDPYLGYAFQTARVQIRADAEYFKSGAADANLDVLVLGGSVAENLVNDGAAGLIEAIGADARFASRKVRIFGYGRAAYKEPQQLHYLQELFALGFSPDVVIALDGFNEVAVGLQNAVQHIPANFPLATAWSTLTAGIGDDSRALAVRYEMQELRETLIERARRFEAWHLDLSAIAASLALADLERQLTRINDASARLLQLTRESASSGSARAWSSEADDAPVLRDCVHEWFEAARSMHAMCRARGALFIEVLQPTLYDPGSKPLTEKELAGAKAEASWKRAVVGGYPMLRAAGKRLETFGVPFCDATRVFADSRDDLYFDACHFVEAGERILGRAIGRELVDLLAAEVAKPSSDH